MTSETLRKVLVAGVAIASLSLAAGCNTTGAAPASATTAAPATAASTVTLDSGKALALAYAGLDGAAALITAAHTAGVSAANLASAHADLDKARALLDAADAAYTANYTDPTAAISAAADLFTAIKGLTAKP